MKRYLRLLNYENACKVVKFINTNDENDYANITTGGISMQISEQNWAKIEQFIKSLDIRYEVVSEEPYKVTQKIVDDLKKYGVIKDKDSLLEINSKEREKDIQQLCEAVLNSSPNCWDNPNGAYETTCPFCGATEYRGGEDSIYASMLELKHEPNCPYLIAKDLSTNCC